MKQNKDLKITYHESQQGVNRTLNIKISTLNEEHKNLLKKFTNGDERTQNAVVNLKLEDLIR